MNPKLRKEIEKLERLAAVAEMLDQANERLEATINATYHYSLFKDYRRYQADVAFKLRVLARIRNYYNAQLLKLDPLFLLDVRPAQVTIEDLLNSVA